MPDMDITKILSYALDREIKSDLFVIMNTVSWVIKKINNTNISFSELEQIEYVLSIKGYSEESIKELKAEEEINQLFGHKDSWNSVYYRDNLSYIEKLLKEIDTKKRGLSTSPL